MSDQHIVIEEPRASFFSNVVAIIGLIVLIVVVIWGLVHLVSVSREWFASTFLGRSVSSTIQVTSPSSATTGETFDVSWKYVSSDKGNYAFLYQCRAGLKLKTKTSAAIPCGTAYTVGPATSLSLVASLSGTSSLPVPFTIVFLPSATSSKQAQGTGNVTVETPAVAAARLAANTPKSVAKPAVATADAPTTPAETTPVVETPVIVQPAQVPVATAPASDVPASPADLAVRILAVGVIDPATGAFINRTPSSPYDIIAVQFDIANKGGSATSAYHFSAALPTTDGYGYVSPSQSSLAPGAHVVNTLRWTDMSPTGGNFSVSVGDADSSSGNNADSVWVSGGYGAQYQR